MRVMISGASGLIGSALTRSLVADGHEVLALTRDLRRSRLPAGAAALAWDGRTVGDWAQHLEEVDAVVNFAGATLAVWPWTAKRKRNFWDSRVQAAEALTSAIQSARSKPSVFVHGSAIGYYGPRGETPVTETDSAGADFGARLCVAAEQASARLDDLGVRRVLLRTAVVLARENVILQLLALPVRLFVGGRLGSGKQGLSWIHIADQIAAIRFLLQNPAAKGAYNLSAPGALSNADFQRTLAGVLRRPYWFPVPAFLLRLVLGEMGTMVLDGQFVQPERLLIDGFVFRFADAESALRDLLG